MKNNKKIIIALFFSFIMLIGAFAVMTSGNSNNITLPVNNIPATANRTNPVNYYIELSGVPSGTGYYQQLLTINNPSQYGINTAGSNIQFTASNGTLLYAWIQPINSTSMQVLVKNYYGNSVIDMQVLPSFENLFSANGYLSNKSFEAFPIQISGSAGFSSTLPTGSPAGSIGIYANSSYGDYVNLSAKDYGAGTNITFYVWSNGIGDLFFDANSAGTGQMLRFDTRGNAFDSQFNSTDSWTSWNNIPSNSYTPSSSTWYEGIVHFNSNGTVIGYWSYATQNAYGQNATSYYTVSHDGNYIGFIGDALGSSYVTYWNGLAINGTQVFEIPSSMPTYSIKYPVTISESGLPANTSWSFTFNGTLYTLTNTSYTILVNNGIYSLSVNAVNGYDDTYNSTIAVNFDDVNENIVFNFIYSINIIINNPDKAFYEITINENNNITHYNLTSSLITIHVINKNFPVTISINNLKKGYAISNPIISYDIAGNYSINEKIINTNNANNLVNNYTPYIIIVLILTALMIIGLIIKRGRE